MTKEIQKTESLGLVLEPFGWWLQQFDGKCFYFLWSGRTDLEEKKRFSISHVALKVPTDIQVKSHSNWT